MAEKNVILKDGADTLYPKTKAELVEGLPQPTSADNGKMLGVDNGAYALVEGGDNALFWCTQNSTTYNEINDALNAGKLPVVKIGNIIYFFSYKLVPNTIYFTSTTYLADSSLFEFRMINVTGSTWSGAQILTQSAITSSSTDLQTPTAKAVYDLAKPVIAPPSATAGQVWTADGNGGASFQNASGGGLPAVTSADVGKFLRVDANGVWVAETVATWQGGSY